MSPDDIFAAQFWAWPDPAIKRDMQGRVIFVNAAFLGLYGGTVEDWTHNIIGGWPAPDGSGQPYRFETRIPMSEDQPEQIYDWMEMLLSDGNAFAVARNVTVLLQNAGPAQTHSQVGVAATPPEAPMDAPADAVQSQVSQAQDPQAQDPQAQQPQNQVPQGQVPQIQEGVAGPAAADMAQTPPVQTQSAQTPPAQTPSAQAPQMDVNAAPPPPSAAPVTDQNPVAAPPQAAQPPVQAEQDRAYERRALPIEDDNAVLGNNWRDAVIAKAVGVEPEEAKPAASTPNSGVDNSGGPKRILLAEDNAINALLTRTLLEAEGHIVETVQDGQLAVETMKTSTYDLIFMDMRMPNMDGLEATRKIRTLNNVPQDLPIIALTANAFDDDRNACFDSGMNDFMTKPVSAEELSDMVTEWTRPSEERMAS